MSSLDQIFVHENVSNKASLALGDFNLNLLDVNSITNNFVNLMQSFHFLPAITSPTRLFSVLDQIWFNRLSTFCSSLVVEHITDHFYVFISLHSSLKSVNDNSKIKIYFRCVNDENLRRNYESLLGSFDWQSVRDPDPHVFTRRFIESMDDIYVKAFPLKVKYITAKQYNKPWYNKKVAELIKAKSLYFFLYRSGFVSKTENNHFKNLVKNLISKWKSTY